MFIKKYGVLTPVDPGGAEGVSISIWTKNGAASKKSTRPFEDGYKIALLYDAVLNFFVEAYQYSDADRVPEVQGPQALYLLHQLPAVQI